MHVNIFWSGVHCSLLQICFSNGFQNHFAITTDQMIHLPVTEYGIAAYFYLIDPVKIDIFSAFTVAYHKHVNIY
jgi:hypothetical protein